MNELFEYHKQLNMKKIIIAVVIILFCIVVFIEILGSFFNKGETVDKVADVRNKTLEAQNPNSIFYDENNTLSIELSKQ